MQGRNWIITAIAAAMLAGCQQPQKKAEGTSPAIADPFEGAVAQAAKPEPKVAAENLAETVKVAGGTMTGKLFFPTGDPASSVLQLEKAIPVEVQANRPFGYDIKVTNVAKLKLEGVEVLETVPGSFKIKDVTEGTPDGKPNTVTYLIGALNPGESKIVRLQGTATQSGPLGMCLSARYNTSLCMATTVVAPALRLAATGPAEALKCDQLAYKLTVTNSGSGQAKNVKVESVLPDGLTTQDGKAAVGFDAGTLAAGESKEFAFIAKASKTGAYAIKGSAKADENLLAEPASVNTAVKEAILTIAKTGPEKSFIGQPIAYEISVTNKGDAVAKNVSIYDSLPKGVVIQSVGQEGRADATGKVFWNLGDLKPNDTKKVVVVITFDQAGELRSAASVKADCVEAQAAIAQTSLTGVPAILIEVSDQPDPVRVGEQTTYTIEVTNQGTADGTNVKLVCTLEDPMDFVSASGETKEKIDGKVITFAPIGKLSPKAKSVYKVTVKANKPGDVRFKTSMTSDQLGRPVDETEATTFFGQ